MWKEFKAFEARWKEHNRLIGDPRFDRFTLHFLLGGGCLTTDVLESDLRPLAETYDPWFEEWDKLAQQGVFYVPIA